MQIGAVNWAPGKSKGKSKDKTEDEGKDNTQSKRKSKDKYKSQCNDISDTMMEGGKVVVRLRQVVGFKENNTVVVSAVIVRVTAETMQNLLR